MNTTTPTPAAVVASALRDAATCYRAGAGDRAAEHLTRALNGMARHDMTAELTGQAMGAQTLASIALPYRAADACENIATTVERIYADEPTTAEGTPAMSTTTQHKIIGATVRATNRTHGLAPARDSGKPETVTEVVDEYDMTIRTSEGNVYRRGGYTISHYAPAGSDELRDAARALLEPESDEPALDAWIDREDRVGAAGSEADWT